MGIVNTIIVLVILFVIYQRFGSKIGPAINQIKEMWESIKSIKETTDQFQEQIENMQAYQNATIGFEVVGYRCSSGICSQDNVILDGETETLNGLYKTNNACVDACAI